MAANARESAEPGGPVAATSAAAVPGEAEALFAGPGEMRARCRAFDWGATTLGPIGRWPASLRITAATVLASGFPSVVLWGPQLVQLYNDGYVRFLGVKHPAALGMPTFDCWPEVRHITEPIYARVLAGETVVNEEQRYPLRTAGPGAPHEDVYVTVSFAPVGEPGAVAGVLVTAIDVTRQVEGRRLQAERERLLQALEVERSRLGDVFQRAPSFLATLHGRDLVYGLINEAYARIIGHRDVVGQPLLEALPEIRGQGFKELLDRVRDTGEPWVGRATPVQLQRTPGAPAETRYLDMVFQPLTEADGTRVGVVAHGSDVTDHVLARRALEAANQQLHENAAALARQAAELRAAAALVERTAAAEAASRAKSEFLAVMSHELRTPLNAIGGYAELIELGIHGPVTEQQRADLARIQQSQRHLLGLINQVLNYSRVESGAVRYDLADVPVAEALAAAEGLIVPQLRAHGLTYDFGGCDPTLRVRADREKLQQILLNLLTNAIKFTDAAGALSVTCEVRDDRVSLTIADTGVGIAADKLATIFEPFVQVDAKLTRTREGVGLGLAISRDLARGMGGDLTVESEVGAGSTFTLTLPAA